MNEFTFVPDVKSPKPLPPRPRPLSERVQQRPKIRAKRRYNYDEWKRAAEAILDPMDQRGETVPYDEACATLAIVANNCDPVKVDQFLLQRYSKSRALVPRNTFLAMLPHIDANTTTADGTSWLLVALQHQNQEVIGPLARQFHFQGSVLNWYHPLAWVTHSGTVGEAKFLLSHVDDSSWMTTVSNARSELRKPNDWRSRAFLDAMDHEFTSKIERMKQSRLLVREMLDKNLPVEPVRAMVDAYLYGGEAFRIVLTPNPPTPPEPLFWPFTLFIVFVLLLLYGHVLTHAN